MSRRRLKLGPAGCVGFGKLSPRKRDTVCLRAAEKVGLSRAESSVGEAWEVRFRGYGHGPRIPGCRVQTWSNTEQLEVSARGGGDEIRVADRWACARY